MAGTRTDPGLAGWYVISLRPSGQHAAVRRAAAARGARTLPVSTVALRARDAGPTLAAALGCPVVIATSPAAVRFARGARPLPARPGQTWFAVGAGTAAALRRAGIAAPQVPTAGSDSEALLALPALQAVRGVDVGLLTAPGGRGLIAETLAHRGARVRRADVYQREPRVPSPARRAALARLPARAALLVSSAEAFEGLWAQLDARARAAVQARPAVASSARLAAMLAERGFGAIVLAAGAAPEALLDALATDVGRGRFR